MQLAKTDQEDRKKTLYPRVNTNIPNLKISWQSYPPFVHYIAIADRHGITRNNPVSRAERTFRKMFHFPGKLGQYHGCCCSGPLRHHAISIYDINSWVLLLMCEFCVEIWQISNSIFCFVKKISMLSSNPSDLLTQNVDSYKPASKRRQTGYFQHNLSKSSHYLSMEHKWGPW